MNITNLQRERLDYLAKEFAKESEDYKDIAIPEDTEGKQRVLRSLMNIRLPKAINDGNIYLEGDSSIGMVGTNANVENKLNKKIVTKAGSTIINGIGMVTRGGNLENAGEIDCLFIK